MVMHFTQFLSWLYATQFSTAIRDSVWIEPVIETAHVLTLTLFLGFVVLLDLRLLGVVLTQRRMSHVIGQLNPWLYVAYAIMLITGILLFCGDPVSFWTTFPFKAKMVMLLLAGVNTFFFNRTVGRRVSDWDLEPKTPAAAKAAAVFSMILWVAIIAAGRAIAYVLPPPI
jgi:hypothetical protein